MMRSANKLCCLLAAATAFVYLSPSISLNTAKAAGTWECTALPDGSSYVNAADDSLEMYYSTDGNEGRANAEREYDLSGYEQICISFTSEVSTVDSEAVRRLNIQNSSLLTTEIINITGDSLSVFGTDTETVIEAGREYRFDIGVMPETGYAVVWLDSEQIFAGELGSKWRNFNYSSMNILFRNTSAGRTSTLDSEWLVDSYSLTNADEGFTSIPADGDVYVDSAIGSIEVRYNGIKSPEVYSAENYTLTADGEEIPFYTERAGSTARIVPEDGLIPDAHYMLTIKAVSDIFGNVQSENETITFTTAESGYVAPEVYISADRTDIDDTSRITVTLDITSVAAVARTMVYANGEVYLEHDGALSGFDFGGEAGVYEIYVVVWDELGGRAVSDTLTVNIIHNESPVITVTGVDTGMTAEAEALKEVTVSAADTDGRVTVLSAEIGGETYELDPAAENVLDMSGLAPAIYDLTVTAEDDYGAVTTKVIRFTVTAGSVMTEVLANDFEDYESDGAVSPSGISFMLYGDARLTSSADYGEEHGTVCVLSSEGGEVGGQTADGSWGNIVTSGTTNSFSIKMDVQILTDKGFFYFMLRHPSQSQLSLDAQIRDSVLILNNNGSSAVRRDIEPGQWYSIEYTVDLPSHTYSFWLDGELLADGLGMSNKSLTQANTRFIMEFTDKIPVKCGIAIDNMSVSYEEPIPQIMSISNDGLDSAEKVSPYAGTLDIDLNTVISPDSLTAETVQLYCGDESVGFGGISYDSETRKISLTLTEKLRSDHDYSITLTDGITLSDGSYLPQPLTERFSVDFMDVDIRSIEINKTSGGVNVSGSIYNRTGTGGTVYAIVNIFNGNRFVRTRVEEVSYGSAADTAFETDTVDTSGGTRAEVYIWNRLSEPVPASSRIYSLEL